MTATRLDIILPCYNPPSGWSLQLPTAIAEIGNALGEAVELHLILVNDGSRHGIAASEIDFLQSQLPLFTYLAYLPNQGKGHALRSGVNAAKGDLQIYTDIDFPYTTDSLLAIYEALRSGKADIAAGVRDASYYTHVPAVRRFISKLLRWMLRTFLRTKITDTQCGLKGFNAQGRKIFLETRIDRFLFDLEFIFLASNVDWLQMAQVEVQLKPGVVFSKARIGILLRESLNFGSIFLRGMKKRIFPSKKG